MKTAFKIVLGIFLVVVILVSGYFALFLYSVYNLSEKQKIAENTQITREWLEITPKKPLKANRQVQKVLLSIKDYEETISDSLEEIELENGTIIKPEIEIIDENGKIYHLKKSSRLQSSEFGMLIGFSLDEEKHQLESLPQNLTYRSIRIRSDKPFYCKKIIWYDYDLK
jgi:hypothetical protein